MSYYDLTWEDDWDDAWLDEEAWGDQPPNLATVDMTENDINPPEPDYPPVRRRLAFRCEHDGCFKVETTRFAYLDEYVSFGDWTGTPQAAMESGPRVRVDKCARCKTGNVLYVFVGVVVPGKGII